MQTVMRAYLDAAESALVLSRGFLNLASHADSENCFTDAVLSIRAHMNNAEDGLVILREVVKREEPEDESPQAD